MKMHIPMLSAFAGLALFASGCGGTEMESEELTSEPAPRTVGQMGTRYCVDQSSAAADRYNSDPHFCPYALRGDTRLSRGHAVELYQPYCAPTHVAVYSLWNRTYYVMRMDALSPC